MIGFYRAAFLGDNVVAIKALLMLRHSYDGDIIIYTNTQGAQIFSKLSGFICVDSSAMSKQELLAHINAQHFECFILTQPNRWRCKLLSQSNAKRIISFATLANLFNPRISKVFFSRAFSQIPYHKALCKLVAKVDSKRFAKASTDFSSSIYPQFRYPIDEDAKARVQNTLDSATHYLITPKHTPNPKSPANLAPIICLNPFVKSTRINLPLSAYIDLAYKLAARFESMRFVILHYEGAPTPCLQDPPPNVFVFSNDDNLANLIELLRLSCLLISPSTGTIHLADMLHIPTIGIYNRKDSRLWLGDSMQKQHLVILQKPLEQSSAQAIEQAQKRVYTLACAMLEPHS